MGEPYHGRCPLCSEQLYEEGELLRCGTGHYQVERSRFERRWQDFDVDVSALKKKNYDGDLSDKEFSKMEEEQAKQLLKDLQEANLLEGTA